MEVKESEGFRRKTEVAREAGFRLANRRLQPLGHLTAYRKYILNQHLRSECFAEIRAAVFCAAEIPKMRSNRDFVQSIAQSDRLQKSAFRPFAWMVA